jgi:hypothetical protein
MTPVRHISDPNDVALSAARKPLDSASHDKRVEEALRIQRSRAAAADALKAKSKVESSPRVVPLLSETCVSGSAARTAGYWILIGPSNTSLGATHSGKHTLSTPFQTAASARSSTNKIQQENTFSATTRRLPADNIPQGFVR